MNTTGAQVEEGCKIPTVDVELPRCPGCGCVRFQVRRTVPPKADDEPYLRYVRCTECGQPYRLRAW